MSFLISREIITPPAKDELSNHISHVWGPETEDVEAEIESIYKHSSVKNKNLHSVHKKSLQTSEIYLLFSHKGPARSPLLLISQTFCTIKSYPGYNGKFFLLLLCGIRFCVFLLRLNELLSESEDFFLSKYVSHCLVSWVFRLCLACGFKEDHGNSLALLWVSWSDMCHPHLALTSVFLTGDAEHRCARAQEQMSVSKLVLFGITTLSSL